MPTMLERADARYAEAREALDAAMAALDAAAEREDLTDEEERELSTAATEARTAADAALEQRDGQAALERSRGQHKPEPAARGGGQPRIVVDEPDMYGPGKGSFMRDLYRSQLKASEYPDAVERIQRHQVFEVERRAVNTTLMGGVIPPNYLVGLFAKAPRNGRVFADQVNHQPLSDTGMTEIVPRFTSGLSASEQATENTVVSTTDPNEVDLAVPVRTIAGSSPVSRQTLERGGYSDQILFEDGTARYFARLDTSALNGSGAAGQFLGLLNTAGVATSSTATATVAALYPKIADIIQQINTNFGGLGYVADKMFMHPRRWGFFEAALDTANRPLIVPQAVNVALGPGSGAFNPLAQGDAPGYGFVGFMHGCAVFTDANIPTNLGGGTNEDRIIVVASPVTHLWERSGDPVTLTFEQTTGTALTVNLVFYGYAAFTAGRYPGSVGVVSGAGLVPPTF